MKAINNGSGNEAEMKISMKMAKWHGVYGNEIIS